MKGNKSHYIEEGQPCFFYYMDDSCVEVGIIKSISSDNVRVIYDTEEMYDVPLNHVLPYSPGKEMKTWGQLARKYSGYANADYKIVTRAYLI